MSPPARLSLLARISLPRPRPRCAFGPPDASAGEWRPTHTKAESPSTGGVNIAIYERGLRFSIWSGLNDLAASERQALFEAVNDLNGKCMTKFFVNTMGESPAFFCTLPYFGLYDKKHFAEFVSIWERDQQAVWEADAARFLR